MADSVWAWSAERERERERHIEREADRAREGGDNRRRGEEGGVREVENVSGGDSRCEREREGWEGARQREGVEGVCFALLLLCLCTVFGCQIASPASRKSRTVLEKCNMCAVYVCLSMFSNGFVVTVCVCVCVLARVRILMGCLPSTPTARCVLEHGGGDNILYHAHCYLYCNTVVILLLRYSHTMI